MAQMDQSVSGEALQTAMADEIKQMTEQVARAVSEAGPDDVIGHSEYQVREALGTLRTKMYQQAVQMRIDAAQAAFSPSGELARPGTSSWSQRLS